MSSVDHENIAPAVNRENIPTSTHGKRKSTDTDVAPKKRTKTAKTSTTTPTSTMTPAQRTKKLAALVKKCVSAIKKTGHHPHGKPYTEVVEGMTYADALALLGSSGTVKTDNARWHRRMYTPREIVDTFGMPKLVHPIKYTGKVLCFRGDIPYIYAYAAYESLEVSMEKKSLLLKLKFRTFYRGAGRPDYIAPHMDAMEAYIDDDDDRGNIERILHGL